MIRFIALFLVITLAGCGGGAIRKGYEASERMEVVLYNGAVSRLISEYESRMEKDSLPENYGEYLKEIGTSLPAGLWVPKPVEIHYNTFGRFPTFQLTPNDGLVDFMSAAEGTGIGSVKPRSIMQALKGKFKGSLVAVIQTFGIYDPDVGGVIVAVRMTIFDRVQDTLVLDRIVGRQVVEADPDAPYARLGEPLQLKALKASLEPALKKILDRMRSQRI